MIVQPDVYGDFWASLPGEDEFRVASDLMVGGHLTTDKLLQGHDVGYFLQCLGIQAIASGLIRPKIGETGATVREPYRPRVLTSARFSSLGYETIIRR